MSGGHSTITGHLEAEGIKRPISLIKVMTIEYLDQYPLFITIVCVSNSAQRKAFVEVKPEQYLARIALFSVAGAG